MFHKSVLLLTIHYDWNLLYYTLIKKLLSISIFFSFGIAAFSKQISGYENSEEVRNVNLKFRVICRAIQAICKRNCANCLSWALKIVQNNKICVLNKQKLWTLYKITYCKTWFSVLLYRQRKGESNVQVKTKN